MVSRKLSAQQVSNRITGIAWSTTVSGTERSRLPDRGCAQLFLIASGFCAPAPRFWLFAKFFQNVIKGNKMKSHSVYELPSLLFLDQSKNSAFAKVYRR